jgi:peptidoglycan/LPS O-acetylase OafA/YrhL
MNKTFKNIQGLRGVAVLAVIFFHLLGIEKKYSPDQLLPDWLQLGAVGVDLFFLISGFIMLTITRQRQTGRASMQQFLLHRCIRIYPLYWIISLMVIISLLLMPDMAKNLPDSPHYVLLSLLLLPQEHLPLLSVGWTLVHEMYFYAVFCALLLLPKHWHLPTLALWSVSTVVFWNFLEPVQEQPWPFLLANPLTLEFTAGCFIAALLQHWQPRHAGVLLTLGVVATGISWQLWTTGNTEEFPLGGMRVICFLLPCALILTGVIGLEKNARLLSRWLQKTGDASYALYLTHILVLSAGGKLWQGHAVQASPADNLMWLTALLGAILITGFSCHHWIEKPLLRFLRQHLH